MSTGALDLLCMGRSPSTSTHTKSARPITSAIAASTPMSADARPTSLSAHPTPRRPQRTPDRHRDRSGRRLRAEFPRSRKGSRVPPRSRDSPSGAPARPPDDPASDRFPLTFYRTIAPTSDSTIIDARACWSAGFQSRLIFVTGTGLLRGTEPAPAMRSAVKRARAAGTRVVLDVDYRSGLWPSEEAFGANVRSLARFAHIAIGTEEELRAATNARRCRRGVPANARHRRRLLVLKRGGAGARVSPSRDRAPVRTSRHSRHGHERARRW